MEIDYSSISNTYDSYRSFPDQVLESVVELASIGPGSRVLEFGCGTANASAKLRDRAGAEATGMDLSPAMLAKAKAKGLPVIRADADGPHMPIMDSCLDAVLGIYVIHQIRDLPALFAECHRILGGGALVLLTSSHVQIEDQHPAIKRFFPSFVGIDVGRFPDLPELDAALEEAGFGHIEHRETGVGKSPLDEAFLEKVRNKYISTYELLPEEEFRDGVEGLEAYIKGLRRQELRQWKATLIKAAVRHGR